MELYIGSGATVEVFSERFCRFLSDFTQQLFEVGSIYFRVRTFRSKRNHVFRSFRSKRNQVFTSFKGTRIQVFVSVKSFRHCIIDFVAKTFDSNPSIVICNGVECRLLKGIQFSLWPRSTFVEFVNFFLLGTAQLVCFLSCCLGWKRTDTVGRSMHGRIKKTRCCFRGSFHWAWSELWSLDTAQKGKEEAGCSSNRSMNSGHSYNSKSGGSSLASSKQPVVHCFAGTFGRLGVILCNNSFSYFKTRFSSF